MKILVLGNGFDIDHNLPTSYMDFLKFCNAALDIDNPDSAAIKVLNEAQKAYIESLKEDVTGKDYFNTLLKKNYLLNYFNCRIAQQGNNWIDFEGELRTIIQEFRSIELALKQTTQYVADKNHRIHQVMRGLGLSTMGSEQWDDVKLQAVRVTLSDSLDKFSKALEYYIAAFINQTTIIGVCPDVVKFDATHVLTFNYSTTYERVYGGLRWNETVDHIHGIAQKPAGMANIILGITTDGGAIESSFVEVEKYYQRITKRTGSEYKKWLQSRKDIDEKIEVMFFGHSLDATDSDVIIDLIANEKSEIFIYYYNDKAYKSIVANLISILGKDRLIKCVSGTVPKICFVKQTPHTKEDTAGIEITREIRALYKLYMLKESAITELLEKINGKILTCDIGYFYSQRKVISLFEALNELGSKILSKERALEICGMLQFEETSNGTCIYFDPEEWSDYAPWGEEIPCTKKTRELINLLNKANRERVSASDKSKSYFGVLSCKESQEIEKELVRILTEEDPDKAFWEEINEMIRVMHNKKLFEEAITKLNKQNHPLFLKTRIRHLNDAYNEYDFEVEYARQMAENYAEV